VVFQRNSGGKAKLQIEERKSINYDREKPMRARRKTKKEEAKRPSKEDRGGRGPRGKTRGQLDEPGCAG